MFMKFFKSKLVYVILPIFALVMGLGLFFGVGLINRNTNVFDMDDLEDVVSESVSDYEVEMKKYNISNCTFENSDVFAEVRYGEELLLHAPALSGLPPVLAGFPH